MAYIRFYGMKHQREFLHAGGASDGRAQWWSKILFGVTDNYAIKGPSEPANYERLLHGRFITLAGIAIDYFIRLVF